MLEIIKNSTEKPRFVYKCANKFESDVLTTALQKVSIWIYSTFKTEMWDGMVCVWGLRNCYTAEWKNMHL